MKILYMNYKRPSKEESHKPTTITSEQKHHQMVESVLSNRKKNKQEQGCKMHPVASKKCRKCLELVGDRVAQEEEKVVLKEQIPEVLRLGSENPNWAIPDKLLHAIKTTEKAKYRQLKDESKTVKELVSSVPQ